MRGVSEVREGSAKRRDGMVSLKEFRETIGLPIFIIVIYD